MRPLHKEIHPPSPTAIRNKTEIKCLEISIFQHLELFAATVYNLMSHKCPPLQADFIFSKIYILLEATSCRLHQPHIALFNFRLAFYSKTSTRIIALIRQNYCFAKLGYRWWRIFSSVHRLIPNHISPTRPTHLTNTHKYTHTHTRTHGPSNTFYTYLRRIERKLQYHGALLGAALLLKYFSTWKIRRVYNIL